MKSKKRRLNPETTLCPYLLNGLTEAAVEKLWFQHMVYRNRLNNTPPEDLDAIKEIKEQMVRIENLTSPEPLLEQMREFHRQLEQQRQTMPPLEQLLKEAREP